MRILWKGNLQYFFPAKAHHIRRTNSLNGESNLLCIIASLLNSKVLLLISFGRGGKVDIN